MKVDLSLDLIITNITICYAWSACGVVLEASDSACWTLRV